MFRRIKPSASMVVAVIAVVLALGGVSAAATGLINGHKIKPGTVGHRQLAKHSVGTANLGRNVVGANNLTKSLRAAINRKTKVTLPGGSGIPGSSGTTGTTGTTGAAGPAGPAGAKGDTGAKGADGAAGARGPAGVADTAESVTFCTQNVCLDPAPGPRGDAGTGGFGFDSTTGNGVTTLTNGTAAPFNVGVLQYGDTPDTNGQITLTWDPYELSLTAQPNDATCTSDPDVSGEITCSFTDLGHTASSKGFEFTPQNDSSITTVGVTVDTNGQHVTGSYPVAITG